METGKVYASLLILLLFLFTFFLHLHFDPNDTDLWLHLVAGKVITETRSLPRADILTFTRQGEPWSLHEWGYQLFAYSLYSLFGLLGLLIFKSLAITIALLLLFFLLPKNLYLRIIVTLTVSLLLLRFSSIRPQLFSWIFLLVLLHLLHSLPLLKQEKYIYFPLLFFIWGNLHPLHLLGLLMVAFYTIEHFWKTRNYSFILILLLSAAASVLNPLGFRVFLLPFTITSSFINEWQPFSPQGIFFYIYIIFVLFGSYLFFSRKKISRFSFADICCSLLFAALGFISRRHVALAFLILTPLFLRDISFSETSFFHMRTFRKDFFFILFLLLSLLSILFISNFFVNTPFPWGTLPQKEVELIKRYDIQGNIFNDYGYGAYLEFWLYSHNLMYIDSRAETMGSSLLQEYHALGKEKKDTFFQVLDKNHITLVIVRHEMGLTNLLLNNKAWKPLFLDAAHASFVRISPATEQVPSFDVINSGFVQRRSS